MLQRSLETRSFKEVRRLEILQSDSHKSPTTEEEHHRLTTSQEERQAQPTAFLQALDAYRKMYDSDSHYGRIIPMLSSSGMGNSRLVAEVLKRTPGLSICFRSE
ncbi:uncharacterized protein EI90DRAFT_3076366, partial [Cantharellus anzutake]|uniref:uncharacterized protein n=1 Tax=Cantharellus anzutake TaxID=1750568 RepID=UPI001905364F